MTHLCRNSDVRYDTSLNYAWILFSFLATIWISDYIMVRIRTLDPAGHCCALLPTLLRYNYMNLRLYYQHDILRLFWFEFTPLLTYSKLEFLLPVPRYPKKIEAGSKTMILLLRRPIHLDVSSDIQIIEKQQMKIRLPKTKKLLGIGEMSNAFY